VTQRIGAPPPPAGSGDDAAVVPAPSSVLVATTDLLVEGVHFRLDWSSPYDVGRKAAAQNFADVAAMGARPTALLLGLGCPPGTSLAVVDGVADGLRDECALVGAAVVGGDVVRTDQITLAITALGDPGPLTPVTRAGARPGDVLVIAGTVGRSAAGLELLRGGVRAGALVEAHRRPSPPYAAGPLLAAAGATAMIDVSDGIVADLRHVAAASGVRIILDVDALAALEPSLEPRLLLTGGEDHALAATLPPGTPRPAGPALIGSVEDGAGVVLRGESVPEVPAGGWDHFG
jgi:thiamine-monophosphate kinase